MKQKICTVKCRYYDGDGVICNEDPSPCPIYQKAMEETRKTHDIIDMENLQHVEHQIPES